MAGYGRDQKLLKKYILSNSFYPEHEKLREIKCNEYIRRLQNNSYREEAHIDIKSFREDFYKEVAKTLDFIIKLKLEEAKDKIKEY